MFSLELKHCLNTINRDSATKEMGKAVLWAPYKSQNLEKLFLTLLGEKDFYRTLL